MILASRFKSGSDARAAWQTWRRDGAKHKSPNAGQPESAVAGALHVRLGGYNTYAGEVVPAQYIGEEFPSATPEKATDSIRLISVASFFGLAFSVLLVAAIPGRRAADMPTGDPPQVHGGQLRDIARRFGIPMSELLDFSANINPEGPPPGVLRRLRESLNQLSVLTDYPDLQEEELKASIARYADVNPENIAVANGFVPLLEAALRCLSIQSCLLPVPSFVEYRAALERSGVVVLPRILSPESGFRYENLLDGEGQHQAILLANPQNPTGVCHDARTMLDLVSTAAATNSYVLLDEAFIDYVPEQSLTKVADRLHHLVVFRSVTKFHGIPGLRAAYAVTNRALARSLNQNLSPWPISTLASQGVIAALEDGDYAVHARALNDNRRRDLKADLEGLGLITYPSSANFLLFKVPPGVDAIIFWQDLITKHHIVMRSCANYEGLSAGRFRVAVRTREQNLRLVRALAESLSVR